MRCAVKRDEASEQRTTMLKEVAVSPLIRHESHRRNEGKGYTDTDIQIGR
jgi:hypothetical protein